MKLEINFRSAGAAGATADMLRNRARDMRRKMEEHADNPALKDMFPMVRAMADQFDDVATQIEAVTG